LISHPKFWCPNPVSYIGDFYFYYIGDRSWAPKSFVNLEEEVELRVSRRVLTSNAEIRGVIPIENMTRFNWTSPKDI
jgi:hypothetical protein